MPVPNNALEPQTIDKDGKAPKNRFATNSALWSAYQNAKRESDKDQVRLANIRGIFDGFPPDPPEDLPDGFPNLNLKQHSAKVNTYVSTWTDNNMGGDKLFEVQAQHGETSADIKRYSEQLTTFFNEAIQDWEEGEFNFANYLLESVVRDTQMGLFGIGPVYWPDDIDWRWCAIPRRCVRVPQRTKVTLKNAPVLWVETEETVTSLYDKIKGTDKEEKDGWNVKAVKRILYNRTAQTQNGTSGTKESPAEWENRVRNNDTFLQYDFAPIKLIHSYVQEFDDSRQKNGISHYVLCENDATPLDEDKPLYFKDRQYKSFSSVMILFVDNTGPEGDFHGVKGFGDDIYDLCDFNNRFFSLLSSSVIMNNMPMFQSESEADREKLSQITWSRMGTLLPGLTMSQVNLRLDAQGAMSVMNESNRTMNTNTRIFPQNDQSPSGEAMTATQVAFDRQDQAQFTSLQVKVYRSLCLDRLGSEMYRRLSRPESEYPASWGGGYAAKKFREKCKNAGIPEKCRTDVRWVRASRSGGSGNAALDQFKAKELMQIASPGEGQQNAKKLLASALTSWDQVPNYIQDAPVVNGEDWQILMENSAINDGQAFPALAPQDHIKHLGLPQPDGGGHLAIMLTAQQVGMQMQEAGIENALEDAKKLSRTMEAVFINCSSHLDFLAKVPREKEVVKGLKDLLNKFQFFMEAFNQDVGEAMQKAQPQGPQMSAEDQAKLMKAQVEIEIMKMRAEMEMQLKEISHMAKLGNMAEGAAAKREITIAQKEQDLQTKQIESEMNLGIQAEQALIDQEREQQELARTRAQGNLTKVNGEE